MFGGGDIDLKHVEDMKYTTECFKERVNTDACLS